MGKPDLLVIWQNTTEWGGIDVLTARLSTYLLGQNIPHRVVHHEGKRQWQILDEGVRCSPENAASLAARAHTVLLPTITMLRDREAIAARFSHAAVACWITHPLDVITAFFPFAARVLPFFGLGLASYLPRLFPGHYALVQSVLRDLLKGGGLVFMDAATRRQFDLVFPHLSVLPAPLIPIPCPVPDQPFDAPARSDTLRVGYLGRMDKMKWPAIGPLIETALAREARKRPVRLLAITEGALLGNLVSACEKHGIELDRRGYMPNDEARALLCSQTDLAVAMGTSALDIAACGHPVLIVDPAYRRGTPPQKLFRFMHEVDGYTLGEYRDSPAYVPGLRSFADCLGMIGDDGLRTKLADYVRRHHAPDIVFARLLAALRESRARFDALRKGMERIDRSFARLSPRYFLSGLKRRL